MPETKHVVMLSSTFADLERQRAAVWQSCTRRGFDVAMMEASVLASDTALELSLQLVDRADIYLLVLGFRYGSIPTGSELSYTHAEYRRAVKRGIPILRFEMSGDPESWAANGIGMAQVEMERINQLNAFKSEVRAASGTTEFRSPDNLSVAVGEALDKERRRLEPLAPPVELHYTERLVAPPEPYVAHPYTLLGATSLVGRQKELTELTGWLTATPGSAADASVLAVVALGGMGKSAVVWHWFEHTAALERPDLVGRLWWSFYESDGTFTNFVTRALAYVTKQSLDQVRAIKSAERERLLLEELDRAPFLIVLDGLERILRAYARPDAAYLDDDEAGDGTRQADDMPPAPVASQGERMSARAAADPRAVAFLRRLATLHRSRIVISTRLFPADLEDRQLREPVAGARSWELHSLTDDDAMDLWRATRAGGTRAEVLDLLHTIDNYPLLVRALGAGVASFRPAPGDLAAWRRANPAFNPFALPELKQRKAHVLQHALGDLREAELGLLRFVAAFGMPASYQTLASISVGDGNLFADESSLVAALQELEEERGLLGWDRRANRYDAHPIVRGVVYAELDPEGRQQLDSDLARHFEAIPQPTQSPSSVEDLAVPIALYRSLLRLGRAQDAYDVWFARLEDHMIALGASHMSLELLLPIVEQSDLLGRINPDDQLEVGLTTGAFAANLGRHELALRCYDLVERTATAETVGDDEDELQALLAILRALDLLATGSLLGGERVLRAAPWSALDNEWKALACFARGTLLAIQGQVDDAVDHMSEILWSRGVPVVEDPAALGRLLLAQGRTEAVLALLAYMRREPAWRVQAAALEARLALTTRSPDVDERIDAGLVEARTGRMVTVEIGLLLLGAERALDEGDLLVARSRVDDVFELLEEQPSLLWEADAYNLVARIELRVGNDEAATAAARRAYRAAWCDGPPYVYAAALAAASETFATIGAKPPDLPASTVDLPPWTGPVAASMRSLERGEDVERVVALLAILDRVDDEDAERAAIGLGPPPDLMARVQTLARTDPSPLVRLAATAALETETNERVARLAVDLLQTRDSTSLSALERLNLRLEPSAVVAVVLARSDLNPGYVLHEPLLEWLRRRIAGLPVLFLESSDGIVSSIRRALDRSEGTEERSRWLQLACLLSPHVESIHPLLAELLIAELSPDERSSVARTLVGEMEGPYTYLTMPTLDPAVIDRVLGENADPWVVLAVLGLSKEHDRHRHLSDRIWSEPSSELRQAAVGVFAQHLPRGLERSLMTRDLDGVRPWLDLSEPIDEVRVAEAAGRLSRSPAEVRAAYEELAATFPLRLTWQVDPPAGLPA